MIPESEPAAHVWKVVLNSAGTVPARVPDGPGLHKVLPYIRILPSAYALLISLPTDGSDHCASHE